MRNDDFTQKTKRLLAQRVGHRCSNPECQAATSGPSTEAVKSVSVGDAAHITAASPGGPRYDPSFTPEQRRSYDNGIWLCAIHARIVDQDDAGHTVDLLRRWKTEAEHRARFGLGKPHLYKAQAHDGVVQFARLAKSILAALRNYNEVSTMLGVEGPLTQIANVAKVLGVPAPIEIQTTPYPESVDPHNPFLRNRLEGTYTIRFPDGSEESGKAAHASGLELLMEARDSAIVSLEQWIVAIDNQV